MLHNAQLFSCILGVASSTLPFFTCIRRKYEIHLHHVSRTGGTKHGPMTCLRRVHVKHGSPWLMPCSMPPGAVWPVEFGQPHRNAHHADTHTFELLKAKKESTELTSGIVINAEVQIWKHPFRFNWAIRNCRCGIILSNPRYEHYHLIAKFATQSFTLDVRFISMPKTLIIELKFSNIGVSRFKSILRKKGNQSNFQIYRVDKIKNIKKNTVNNASQIPAYYFEGKEKYLKDDILQSLEMIFEMVFSLPERRIMQLKPWMMLEKPHRALFNTLPRSLWPPRSISLIGLKRENMSKADPIRVSSLLP